MIIKSLSVSQAEKFDHKQSGGCELKWWHEYVQKHKPERTEAKEDGVAGHFLLRTYLTKGELPKGRVKMGKAVTAAILKGELPKPGPDLLVEERFDGQPRYDAEGKWIPLNREKAFWLGGYPWDGDIDLQYRRTEIVETLDHKFSSDPEQWAKKAGELIYTIQMPVYALFARERHWPDATLFGLGHHNVSRKGELSFIRRQVVSLDVLLERKEDIEATTRRMTQVAEVTNADDVPFNKKSCEAFGGCPHQSICKRFKEKNTVSLTPEEAAMFADVDPVPAAPAVPVADPFADLEPAPVQAAVTAYAEQVKQVSASAQAFIDVVGPLIAASAEVPEPAAAVLPPDAPKDDATLPPPVKKIRKKKTDVQPAVIVDTVGAFDLPGEQPIPAAMAKQGGRYILPDGRHASYTCMTSGKASFNADGGGMAVLLSPEERITPEQIPDSAPVAHADSPEPVDGGLLAITIPAGTPAMANFERGQALLTAPLLTPALLARALRAAADALEE